MAIEDDPILTKQYEVDQAGSTGANCGASRWQMVKRRIKLWLNSEKTPH